MNSNTYVQNVTHPVLDHHQIFWILSIFFEDHVKALFVFFCLGAWEKMSEIIICRSAFS